MNLSKKIIWYVAPEHGDKSCKLYFFASVVFALVRFMKQRKPLNGTNWTADSLLVHNTGRFETNQLERISMKRTVIFVPVVSILVRFYYIIKNTHLGQSYLPACREKEEGRNQ